MDITREESDRRLLILRNKLLNLSEEELLVFDMDLFFHDCGTAACALGHACTIPEFVELGLSRVDGLPTLVFKRATDRSPPVEYVEYAAGAKFFGIRFEEARWLFHPHTYSMGCDRITPKHVANRIDRLIAS